MGVLDDVGDNSNDLTNLGLGDGVICGWELCRTKACMGKEIFAP